LNDDGFTAAGKIASDECEPVAVNHATEEDRKHLISVLTKRMLKKAYEEARG